MVQVFKGSVQSPETSAPENVLELFEQYIQHCQSIDSPSGIVANTQVMLVRYLIPALGGPLPPEGHCRGIQVSMALNYLKEVPLETMIDAPTILEDFFVQSQTPSRSRRNPRSYLKKLLAFGTEKSWISSDAISTAKTLTPYRFNRPKGQRRTYTYEIRVSGKVQKENYMLGSREGDYINCTLTKELTSFDEFMQKTIGLRPITAEIDITNIKRVLGWLFRFKGISLDELKLEKIVPLICIKLKLRDFKNINGHVDRDGYLLAQLEAREEAKEAAEECVQLVNEFLNFFSIVPSSRMQIIKSVINLAKFVYKDQTDLEETDTFDDIPIIKRLRRVSKDEARKGKDTPRVVPYEVKSVPWPKVLEVLKCLQVEADLTHMTVERKDAKNSHRHIERCEGGVAKSVQRFLILGFLALLPPDRQRSIRELQLAEFPQERGSYLLYGAFEQGIFVPAARMKNPQQAEWLIYQNDYKTSRYHGVFRATIENYQLGSKCLYDYINVWVHQYRALLKPTHNYFFTGFRGQPLQANKFGSMVRCIFIKFAGVPVTPHSLRHSYSTFLDEQDASPSVRRAAAIWMKHDEVMQGGCYNHNSIERRLQPVQEFNQHFIEQVFGSNEEQFPT
jgi:hypothetical protein